MVVLWVTAGIWGDCARFHLEVETGTRSFSTILGWYVPLPETVEGERDAAERKKKSRKRDKPRDCDLDTELLLRLAGSATLKDNSFGTRLSR